MKVVKTNKKILWGKAENKEFVFRHRNKKGVLEKAQRIVNAGSVFLGNYSPESAGDYASGTNHVLPTSGFAKSYSGVSVQSFQKTISFQKLTKRGLRTIAQTVEVLAYEEGLKAHAKAVSIRFLDK